MGQERIDTRLLEELTEQSQDLNSDALRITRHALADLTAAGGRARGARHRWRRGATVVAAGTAAVPHAARATAASPSPSPSSPPSASGSVSADDIMALQTAAALENLAVSVYRTAAGLPFTRNGNAAVAAFLTRTTRQHQEHAQAFNAAATRAGGQAQHNPDPRYRAVVDQTLPTITDAAGVVRLALSLEDLAAQTYTRYVALVDNTDLRRLFASVAPVEAQHRSVLLAVQALLADGAADLVAIPVDPAKLPAAAGSAGIPDTFCSTTDAMPISEGAVK